MRRRVARAASVWPGTARAQLSACKVWRVAYASRASVAGQKDRRHLRWSS